MTTYGYTGTQQTSKAVYAGDQPTLGNETSQVTFAYDLQGRMETVVTETWSGGNLTRRELQLTRTRLLTGRQKVSDLREAAELDAFA